MTDSEGIQETEGLEVQLVPIDTVVPNAFNPKDDIGLSATNKQHYLGIKKSLKTHGQVQPITVREIGNKKFEIVDGYHRWMACKELKYKYISVINLGTVSEEKARELLVNLEKAKVPINEVKLSQLVSGLHEKIGEDIYKTLPFSKSQTDEYLTMADFDWELQAVQPAVYTNWAVKCTNLERNAIVLAFKALQSKHKDTPSPQLVLDAFNHYGKSIRKARKAKPKKQKPKS